jgi:hypothetical protein
MLSPKMFKDGDGSRPIHAYFMSYFDDHQAAKV